MDLIRLFAPGNVLLFILLLTRVSGLMVTAPFFNHMGVPMQVKVGFAIGVALVLYPLVGPQAGSHPYPNDIPNFLVVALQEISIGLMMGYAANLVFEAIRMAGEHISMQMGMSVASALDPVTHGPTQVIGQFYFFIALLVFLMFNVHHGIIQVLNHTFTLLPLGENWALNHSDLLGHLAERFVVLTSEVFLLGLLIALPVMGILFVTEMALGFVAKVMPQMNIFMVGLPLKVTVGLMTLGATLPYTVDFLTHRYEYMLRHLKLLFVT